MIEDARDPRPVDVHTLGEAWPTPAPPEDFIDRVMQARGRPGRRRLGWGAALAAGALGVAAVVVLVMRPGPRPAERGALTAAARTTVAIGSRARAVAEAGTSLRYEVAPNGGARIVQDRGNVFYRVDQVAGPAADARGFRVHTPSAEVHVTGTCFRVAVEDAATVVTVMEGSVTVKDARGVTALGAGESVTTRGAAAVDDPLGATPGGGASEASKFTDFSPGEWAAMARRCALRMQLPPYAPALHLLSDEEAARLRFGARERAAYDQELQRFARDQMARLVGLHQLLTRHQADPETDPEASDDRSYVELDAEIRAQAAPAALAAARRRYAEERAGLAPPRDPATLPALDRFIDLHAGASERFEARLAARLGQARARAVRNRPGVLKLGAEGCHPQ